MRARRPDRHDEQAFGCPCRRPTSGVVLARRLSRRALGHIDQDARSDSRLGVALTRGSSLWAQNASMSPVLKGRSRALSYPFVLLAVVVLSGCQGDRSVPASRPDAAVVAANNRYGPEWSCERVGVPAGQISCRHFAGGVEGWMDEFRIVNGRALYWNGVRTAPASRFIPDMLGALYPHHGGRIRHGLLVVPERRIKCRVLRASLPYKVSCGFAKHPTAHWILTVDIDGSIYGDSVGDLSSPGYGYP